MKTLCTVIFAVLLFTSGARAQIEKTDSNRMPAAATIKITLLDMPGVLIEKSKWEVAYELRIINEKELQAQTVNGRLDLDADKKIGEFITKGSFTKTDLAKKENREAFLSVPLDEKIQKKLIDEFEIISKSKTAAPTNGNSSEAVSERAAKSQFFVMYANVLVYDAKLKKNILVPFDWILPFARFSHFPGANFQMTFRVTEDGKYARSMVLPEKTKKSITITTRQ